MVQGEWYEQWCRGNVIKGQCRGWFCLDKEFMWECVAEKPKKAG